MDHDKRQTKKPFAVDPSKIQDEMVVRRKITMEFAQNGKLESDHHRDKTTHGLQSHCRRKPDQAMSMAMMETSVFLQHQLFSNWKNIIINPVEVFPINEWCCEILVTGWIPQSIILTS